MNVAEDLNKQTLLNPPGSNERDVLVHQVRHWAGLNTDALLEPLCQVFRSPTIPGFIGYRMESQSVLVFGEPVCEENDKLALAEAFKLYCDENKWSVSYAIVSQEFTEIALKQMTRIAIQYGNKLVLNPMNDPLKKTGSKGSLIRKKTKHAIKEDVSIQEYLEKDIHLENEMRQIGDSWLSSRHGPQVYIAHLRLFEDSEGKRWFYAKQGDKIVGLIVLNAIHAKSGWLLNNLIQTKEAPSGTSELLITSTFETLRKEGCSYVEIGPVTAKKLDHMTGLGLCTGWLAQITFKLAKKFLNLDGQTVFWEKFEPHYEPSYLLFDKMNFGTIKALKKAMNVSIR